MSRSFTTRVLLGALALACLSLTGCGPRPLLGDLFKQTNTYVYQDEEVQVRMLTHDEVYALPAGITGVTADQWHEHLETELPKVFPPPDRATRVRPQFAAPVVALVGAAVGFAVDQIKAEVEKEAELYEAQFSASRYGSGFWETLPGNATGTPHYWGIEITRYARGYNPLAAASGKGPATAYRLICAVVPASLLTDPSGGFATDERIFAIKPLLFETNASRAKVLQFTGHTINSRVNLALDAIWIDQSQAVHQERVATADFDFKGQEIVHPTPQLLKGKLAGWFAGLPVSVDEKGNLKGNGAFKLTALVTESDPGQAKQTFERIAKYIGDQKDTIVKATTKPFGS